MSHDRSIVLSYHDAIIRKSDYDLIDSRNWINDTIIEFWFEYLSNDLFKQFQAELLCVSPSLSQLIKLTSNSNGVEAILEPLDFKSRKLILFPINDHLSTESVGGTHWSLLVYTAKHARFEHYDSANSVNIKQAQYIVKKLKEIFFSNADPNIQIMPCHQQDNSYDCGIHLICNSEAVCRKYLLVDEKPIAEIASIEKIKHFRKELIKIIDSIKNDHLK